MAQLKHSFTTRQISEHRLLEPLQLLQCAKYGVLDLQSPTKSVWNMHGEGRPRDLGTLPTCLSNQHNGHARAKGRQSQACRKTLDYVIQL